MKTLQLLVLSIFCLGTNAQRPGDLNSEFAEEGIFLADWEDTSSMAFDIAVLSTGDILITGALDTDHAEQADILVMRLDDHGSPQAYGNYIHGFKYDINSTTNLSTAIKILPDNTVLVAGMSVVSISEINPVAIRLLPEGQLDESFAEDGVYTTETFQMSVQNMEVYAQEESYSFILCGETVEANPRPLMIMINNEGELVSSFGIAGFLQLTGYEGKFIDLAVDVENNYLYGSVNLVGGGALVTKFNLPDGNLNTDFGTGGILSFTPADGFEGSINAIVLDKSDNTLAAFGQYFHPEMDWDIFSFRVHATNGLVDVSFGVNGISTLRLPDRAEMISSAILQSDGKYYFGGVSNYIDESDFFLGRINHNGMGDTSFGTAGLVLTPYGYEEQIKSLVLSPSEDILYAAGVLIDGSENKIMVTSYHTISEVVPPVNLDEVQSNGIKLYPNPSTDMITIETGKIGQQIVRVYDLAGKELINKSFSEVRIELNLELLEPSIYFIHVILPDGQSITNKLIRK